MSYMEPNSICSHEEYLRHENARIYPDTFIVDELYTIMASVISANGFDKKAAKAPVRVNQIEQQKTGIYAVKFCLLGPDLLPNCDFGSTFNQDGYLESSVPELVVNNETVNSAYLKGYSEAIDQELEEIFTSQTVPV